MRLDEYGIRKSADTLEAARQRRAREQFLAPRIPGSRLNFAQSNDSALALTDLGNASRLVLEHGRDLRFAPGLGWYAWDGRRWKRDDSGEPIRRAKQTVKSLYAEAAKLDDSDAKRVAKWAIESASASRLHAAVKLAETERDVIVAPDDLDADPWAFNAVNGTIELQTGELREHRREDLLTRISSVAYEPEARHDRWDSFLEWVTDGDQELAAFLQRAFGYTLTGHTHEEVLFFVHGGTATGKSSILEAMRAVKGEYAAVADFESFLKRRGDAGVRNDLARLAGARFVVSIEVGDGRAIAEGLLKMLTGGDTVTARHLYSQLFEFTPAFKLWLCANARPKVSADDDAIWRRILQVPFLHTVPEDQRDERVKLELRTDPTIHTAILAWAVQGCLEWQRIGLAIPQAVRDYTDDYRAENDLLRDWLADVCRLDPSKWTSNSDLRTSYEAWCERNGEKPVTHNKLAALLKAKGCTSTKRSGTRGWEGIDA
jgi:putative DNA primase/helicase